MKLSGKKPAMKKAVQGLAPRRSQTPDRPRSPALQRLRSDSIDRYSSVESLPGSDNEDVSLSSLLPPLTPPTQKKPNNFHFQITLPPASPSHGEAKGMPLSPPTPTVNVLTKFIAKSERYMRCYWLFVRFLYGVAYFARLCTAGWYNYGHDNFIVMLPGKLDWRELTLGVL